MTSNKACRVERSRLLTPNADVFTHNAWDDVEWSDEQLAHAVKIVEAHNEFAKNAAIPEQTNSGDVPRPKVAEHTNFPDEHELVSKAVQNFGDQSVAWNEFYAHHHGNFFKKRQWLPSEFPELFHAFSTWTRDDDVSKPLQKAVSVLETGCGAGATVVSLLEMLPATNDESSSKIMLYCCDISANAVNLLQNWLNDTGNARRCQAFHADISADINDCGNVWPCEPESIDFILLLYTLSALSPQQMPQVIKNLYILLRPGGIVFFRDYGMYDLAQLRFKPRQCLGENFYQRGDGTTTYFFTRQMLDDLFVGASGGGFEKISCTEDRRFVLNRKRELKMYRVWLQAKYRKPVVDADKHSTTSDAENAVPYCDNTSNNKWRAKKVARVTSRMREKLTTAGVSTIDDDNVGDETSNIVAIYNAGTICGFSAGSVETILNAKLQSDPSADSLGKLQPNICVIQHFSSPNNKNLTNFAFILCDSLQIAMDVCRALHGEFVLSDAGREHLWVAARVQQLPPNLCNLEAAKSLRMLPQKPDGLTLFEDFVSPEFERDLLGFVEQDLNRFESTTTNNAVTHDRLKRRTALHYGSRFAYESNSVQNNAAVPPMPPICNSLLSKLTEAITAADLPVEKTDDAEKYFNQLTINIYEPGGGIPAHTDIAEFGEFLVSLSLESDIAMDFEQQSTANKFSLLLPARSLLVLHSDARWHWTHAIKSRKCDLVEEVTRAREAPPRIVRRGRRVSFTFRHVNAKTSSVPGRTTASDDTSSSANKPDPATLYALERRHVQDVYDQIAQKFSATRYKAWPRVAQFLDSLEPGSLVLDAGCGNGKYMHYAISKRLPMLMIGFDFSAPLVDICSAAKKVETFQADILNAPIRAETFDAAICIAVLHHLSSHERRALALRRLLKCLRVGGTLLVYVWAFEQRAPILMPSKDAGDSKADESQSKYIKERREKPENVTESAQIPENVEKRFVFSGRGEEISLPLHTNRTEFRHQDVLVPFSTATAAGGEQKLEGASADTTFYRYYHVFSCNELEKLCDDAVSMHDDTDASNEHLQYERVESYYDQGNWCVIIRRI